MKLIDLRSTLFKRVVNFLGAMDDCTVSEWKFLDNTADDIDELCTIGLGITNGFATGWSRRFI